MSANAVYLAPGQGETVFSVSSSPIKFGAGALAELGMDAQALGMKRVALFVDPHVLASRAGETALGALRAAGVDAVVFDRVRCEPNSDSFEEAAARPFTSRPRPSHPSQRPPYQGSTPYNDIGSLAAIRLGGKFLVRAVRDAGDKEARYQLMFASTLAGLAVRQRRRARAARDVLLGGHSVDTIQTQ